MRSNRLLAGIAAATLGASLLVAQAPSDAPSDAAVESPAVPPAAAERSTGQVEAAIEPVAPPSPTRLTLPADKLALVESGKVSAARPAHYAVEVPAGRTIEIRIRSADPAAHFSIQRPGRQTPAEETSDDSGTVGWISSTEEGGEMRILVRTTGSSESAFQLLVRVQPPEAPEAGAVPES